jgi:hypothetical protein
MLNKALQAVIMQRQYKYLHPTDYMLWCVWETPAWVPDAGGDGGTWDEDSDHAQFACLLVKAGADSECHEYERLVMLALLRERVGVFKALMGSGPVPAAVKEGRGLVAVGGHRLDAEKCKTVLHYTDPACYGAALVHACEMCHDHVSAVCMLLKRGADVNHGSGAPLQAAMCQSRAYTAAVLILHGAHVEEDSQVEQLYRMAAEEKGGAQLARALEVRGIHLKGSPASIVEGAEAAQAPHAV